MNFEEAKKTLNGLSCRCKKCDDEYCDGCYIDSEEIGAISTILQELDKLQKENDLAKKALIANSYEADERNTLLVKIQELQKENEEYSKQMDLDYVDENFVSKDKIREKIEKIKHQLTNKDFTHDMYMGTEQYNTWTRLCAKEEVLQNLLKEE